MVRPPNRYRRRKRRRLVALSLLIVMAPITAGAYAYWRDTRFPAHSAWVAGMPVELRIQDGVAPSELRAIRRGLRLTDRFMRIGFGSTVRGHVEARIAKSNGCRAFQKVGEAIVGEAERGFLCIDTASPAWQWLMLKDRLAASAAAGHEYVHVLQGEHGCLQSPLGERFRWIVEGMAEEVSWRALVAADRTTEAQVERRIRDGGALNPNLEPLQRYERDGGRDPEYALWHVAVRRLLGEAVASGSAPRARPELALRRFCDRIGARRPWREAFERSFGVSLRRFYALFERRRGQARADSTGDGSLWR
jgi:hypothetical protein